MTLTVLYFAAVAELAGRVEERVTLADERVTIATLAAHLERVHAPLTGRLTAVRFACNETFVELAHVLRDGDVVAVIPPVAGG